MANQISDSQIFAKVYDLAWEVMKMVRNSHFTMVLLEQMGILLWCYNLLIEENFQGQIMNPKYTADESRQEGI